MKNCGNKVKNTCGEKVYATCVYYEENVPVFSGLSSLVEAGGCVTLEETTDDTYELIGAIKDEIDLSELGEDCLSYVQEGGKTIVKNVLIKYEEEICLLKARVLELETTAICNVDITECGLTLGVDDCDNPITTLGQLLEYILTNLTPTP
jgi:hypothetical protein